MIYGGSLGMNPLESGYIFNILKDCAIGECEYEEEITSINDLRLYIGYRL